jgi:heme/copper-type cytochrome/quinol oxidase subunit 3
VTTVAVPGTTPPAANAPVTVAVPPPPPARRPGYPVGFWGMVCLIATEATIFTGLIATYFFLRASSPAWPQGGIKAPDLKTVSVFSVILVGSSVPLIWAEYAITRGRLGQMRLGLAVSFLMGAAFLAHEGYEWAHLEFPWTRNAYTSIFYVTTGLHGLHVLVGLLISAQVQTKAAMGKLSSSRHVSLTVFGLYWHFVDGVWIFVFSSLYLSAHIR